MRKFLLISIVAVLLTVTMSSYVSAYTMPVGAGTFYFDAGSAKRTHYISFAVSGTLTFRADLYYWDGSSYQYRGYFDNNSKTGGERTLLPTSTISARYYKIVINSNNLDNFVIMDHEWNAVFDFNDQFIGDPFGNDPTNTPTPTNTTAPPPTNTPIPTAPTNTPTPTNTPAPTITPAPTATPRPLPPDNNISDGSIRVINVTQDTIKISWDDYVPDTYYKVALDGSYLNQTYSKEYEFTNLQPNTAYDLTVIDINNNSHTIRAKTSQEYASPNPETIGLKGIGYAALLGPLIAILIGIQQSGVLANIAKKIMR
jgi:hypothetical protein